MWRTVNMPVFRISFGSNVKNDERSIFILDLASSDMMRGEKTAKLSGVAMT